MRGLTSLTEPDDDDSVGAVIDVAVIGARGDGKTQFIVHAIRTLRAYAPLLEGTEHQYNRDVLQVVMSAREPRPEATPPGVVPHYVFRIRPDSLLSQVGFTGRLALYARVAGLLAYVLLAVLNAGLVAALLTWLRGAPDFWASPLASMLADPIALAAAGGLLVVGCAVGTMIARRRFMRRGDIEIVFWDVAGEHVYSSSAADYYSFLSALVRQRRQRASARRSYAFAPVLICNPISLGTRIEGSPYARLRQLIPLFASLNEPLPRAMVAINRWTVVKEVCAPDADRDETVAVIAQARIAMDSDAAPTRDQGEENGDESGEENGDGDDSFAHRRRPLPMVERDVVRKHCLDAEDGAGDGEDRDIYFSYLRYDAGIQCEFRQRKWKSWDDLPGEVQSRWRAPSRGTPDRVLEYIYEDGPGSFRGEVRRSFLEWLAGLAFHPASYRRVNARRDAGVAPRPANTAEREAVRVRGALAEAKPARTQKRSGEHRSVTRDSDPAPKKPTPPEPSRDEEHNAWKPRPLSAEGLEDFARGTIATDPAMDAVEEPPSDLDASSGDVPLPRLALSAPDDGDFDIEDDELNEFDDDGEVEDDGDVEDEILELGDEDVKGASKRTTAMQDDGDPNDDADDADDAGSDSDFVRESTAPGFGPAADTGNRSNNGSDTRADTGANEGSDDAQAAADRARANRHGDTLPLSGGFGSSGT